LVLYILDLVRAITRIHVDRHDHGPLILHREEGVPTRSGPGYIKRSIDPLVPMAT
jgi:hypothetical protein